MAKNTKHTERAKLPTEVSSDFETDPKKYQWGVIYLAKDQRFQCHNLEGDDNNLGLLEFLNMANIHLTQGQRLKAHELRFSTNSVKQSVYLFCTIQKGKYRYCKGSTRVVA